MGVLESLKRILDRKISDRTMRGFNAEEIKSWLGNVKEVDSFKYYYYPSGSKFPTDSKRLENPQAREVLSFLSSDFSESSSLYVEMQFKAYKSGRHEIILRGINLDGEITKIAVLDLRKSHK